MWDHDCKVEKTMMSVGDGELCNWCGRGAEDETSEFGKLDKGWDDEESSFDVYQATRDTLEEFDLENEIMNEESITNVQVTDMPDGSAKVTMDLNPEVQKGLMKQGLQYIIEEMKMADKVMVMDPNDFTKETKTWELDDEEANALFHFGFIHAIKSGIEKGEV